ncbi:SDR family oxidoreductase [Candidatus Sulfidibacterium hydrothermale]|uniref:SDR family oxidoreductase n=1 Tax=Candidatus Sulfidibacterium hydrothermale TaxID=2875962 RepID=UPI001F0A5FE8|nr:SDR family oxidoreductase [Candidatus Sulfidibacterium hydrothermale]UBM62818.1 SDR family oxidoreductase [Candidatus Sulfidibacterium hydrothermale]
MKNQKEIVLITGATSGIGLACAETFAENGHPLIITGRRADRLQNVQDSLQKKYKVEVLTLNFDVRDKKLVEESFASLPESWKNIGILINNAGLAVGFNPIQEGVIDDWERMIDTNIKGLLYVTRAILPGMTERKKGHIVNIGSIAGKEVYPNGNVYCATKFAVDALTKAIRIDAVQYGIKVTQVAPGAVETEFSMVRFKGDKDKADAVYKGYEPLHPEDIASVVYFSTTLPPHVNLNDMVIMPTAQASATVFHKQL